MINKKILLTFAIAIIVLTSTIPLTAYSQAEEHHNGHIDDYLRFVPVAAVYTMKLSGVDGASSWKRLLVNTAASYALNIGVTYALKEAVHDMRPDRTNNDAFPSGHTAVAFSGAHILQKEYGQLSPWISIAGYGMAAATAINRVRCNHHEWDDVLAGAAIGLATTEIGYRLGDLITGERSRYSIGVSPQGLALVVKIP